MYKCICGYMYKYIQYIIINHLKLLRRVCACNDASNDVDTRRTD